MNLSPSQLASWVVMASLATYVAIRAAIVPITFDEALTVTWHIPGTWKDILLLRTPGLEDNNHVLLTLLSKVFASTYGVSEFAIRFPTLMGYGLFLVALYSILGQITTGWLRPLGMIVVGANPYLVDYFSIARGYGLALGLSTAGVALMLGAVRAGVIVQQTRLYQAFLLLTLATTAHLTFVLLLVAAVVVVWAPYLLRGRVAELRIALVPTSRAIWGLAGLTVLLQAYVVHLVLVVKRVGLFTSGQATGFWTGTVGSLVDGVLPLNASPLLRASMFCWIVLTTIVAAIVVAAQWRMKRTEPLAILFCLLLLVSVGSVLQHLVFGVALLDGRRAIAILMLFLLCALALPQASQDAGRTVRAVALGVGIAAPGVLAIGAGAALNFVGVRDWRHDAAARDVMLAIKQRMTPSSEAVPMRMRVFWALAPALDFYRIRLGLEATLEPIQWDQRPGYRGDADLYYVLDEQVSEVDRAEPVMRFQSAGTTLLTKR